MPTSVTCRNVTNIKCDKHQNKTSKPLYPTTTKLKSKNLILPMIATVTAATQVCAPWTENATTKT